MYSIGESHHYKALIVKLSKDELMCMTNIHLNIETPNK